MSLQKHYIPWLNWGVASLFALVQFLLQASTGLMAEAWQHEFNLTTTQVGSLSAAFYLSYVLMQIPVGLVYDRFGTEKIMSAALLLVCIGTFALGLSQNYWQGFVARIVMGVGCSFGFVGMLYVTSAWFNERHFALLVGIGEALAMLGVASGELGMAWIISAYGWRQMMFMAGFAIFVIMIFAVLFIRNNEKGQLAQPAISLPFTYAIKQVLCNKQIWAGGIYGFALFAIIAVFVTLWGVPFYTQYQTYSLHTASAMMSMVFIGTAAGAPFMGFIISRWNIRPRVMTYSAIATAILFGIILYWPSLSEQLTYLVLFLVGFSSASYVQIFAIIKESVALNLRATALGTANMIFMFCAPILQPLVGKALERQYSFSNALSLIEFLLLLAIGVSFSFLSRSPEPIRLQSSKIQ